MGQTNGNGIWDAGAKCGGDAIAAPHYTIRYSVAYPPSKTAGAKAASLAAIAAGSHSADPIFSSPDGIP